jgi:hypothetical protein
LAKIAERKGLTPLEILLGNVERFYQLALDAQANDKSEDEIIYRGLARENADKAAPYCHQKLSTMTVGYPCGARHCQSNACSRFPIADVFVPLNTIQLRHQPMAFDPVRPVKAFRMTTPQKRPCLLNLIGATKSAFTDGRLRRCG